MTDDTTAKGVDEVAVRGIAAKVQELYAAEGTFLSFPLAAVAYLAEDLRFLAPGGLTAEQAQTLAEFSELVNRLPLPSQVWTDDGSGRHLWDVYGDLLAAELATSERTTAEEQAYQRAYAYLHTVMPEPPDPPSQVLLDYQGGQATYLAAETAWRNGKDGPDAGMLQAAQDQAWQDWKDLGHKDDVEEARLTLTGLSDKDPSVAWSRYRMQFDPQQPASFQTAPNGTRYASTGFAPFGSIDVPWPRMSMDRTELDAAAASAAPELATALQDGAATGTVKSVSFDYTAVDVTRPWFEASMLDSRAWRFRSGTAPLSDGATPPTGRCPAYVTKLVLARNISVTRTKPVESGTSSPPMLAFLEPLHVSLLAQQSTVAVLQPEPAPLTEFDPDSQPGQRGAGRVVNVGRLRVERTGLSPALQLRAVPDDPHRSGDARQAVLVRCHVHSWSGRNSPRRDACHRLTPWSVTARWGPSRPGSDDRDAGAASDGTCRTPRSRGVAARIIVRRPGTPEPVALPQTGMIFRPVSDRRRGRGRLGRR